MKTYLKYRSEAKDGDILQYKGTGFFSNAIKFVTAKIRRKKKRAEKYSHSGIIIRWGPRLMVAESTSQGIYPVVASTNIKNYHGEIDVYRLKEPLTDDERRRLVDHAKLQFGKEYPRWKLVKFAHRLIWKIRNKKDKYVSSVMEFCSEFVSACYNVIGRDVKKDLADADTSPEDIASSNLLEKIMVLKP